MSRKKWVVLGVIAAIVLLVGIVGGVAMAQEENTATGNTLLARVASILGLQQTQVEAAFEQARTEMQAEAQDARLQALVDDGRITGEQAKQYKQWLESKPDIKIGSGIGKSFGMYGFGGMRGHRCGQFGPN